MTQSPRIEAKDIGMFLVAALFWVVLLSGPGCGKKQMPVVEKKPEEAVDLPKPKVPDDVMKGAQDKLTSKVLVTGETAKERLQRKQYIFDPKIPGGAIKGLCYVPFGKAVRVNPQFPVELTGQNAIKEPQKGEMAYYEARQPAPPSWFANYFGGAKRYGIKGAVIMVRGVDAGSVQVLDWVSYRIDYRTQQILASVPQGEGVNNDSWYNVGLCPYEGMVQLANLGLYDCHIVSTHLGSGKVIFNQVVKAYNDKKFPGLHFGVTVGMQSPELVQMPPMKDTGIYSMVCTRHPWQKAHLIVWDSPYVTVTREQHQGDPARTGEFTISKIPPGKYKVDVWHPEYEPVKKTYDVEINADQFTELPIEFKVPAALTAEERPFPDKPITEWAVVGPMPALYDQEPDAPNRKLDFSATYEGMANDTVGWKRITTDPKGKNGWINLKAVAGQEYREPVLVYFAAQLTSPRAQKIAFYVNTYVSTKIWLNGKVVHQPYAQNLYYGTDFMITSDLKAGDNILLVMVSAHATGEKYGFVATCVAEGVEARSPVK